MVVRKVDKRVYRRFKQKALEEDTNIGDALTEALEEWLERKQNKKRPNIKELLKANGFIKTGRRVRWSKQIDEALYG